MLNFNRNHTNNHVNDARANPARRRDLGRSLGSDGGRAYTVVRDRVQQRLLAELNPAVSASNHAEVRRVLERILGEVLAEMDLPVSRNERTEMFEQIVADILGFGPLEPLLQDTSITEVLVNGPKMVFVERNGVLEETDLTFSDNTDVMRIIERIVAPLGRRVDESSPMVDARLPDGSRVNVIIPPLSLVGPCISIRKFSKTALSVTDLTRLGALTQEMADFLKVCVKTRLNIVVSGGTSTGKTTFLNMLSSFLPDKERILTIEDAAELRLQQKHVVSLESRPANVEGQGQTASANWSSTPCACAPTALWWARCAAPRRWTCCKP